MLDRAWELIHGVPYQVSARWVFYRLLQEGWYSKKSDYKNKFIKATSVARKTFYKGWRPDTLADDTRAAIVRGRGFGTVDQWLQGVKKNVVCNLDKWARQDHYIELWYEARAMTDQFSYYTKYVTLRPMGGQPSIPYKWEIAKDLERCHGWYGNPITVLYFGDLDEAGETISETVRSDVSEWCDVEFDFVHCGLTPSQVRQYNVPENPEKPGQYQWEALTDQAAQTIIRVNVDKFLRHDAFTQTVTEEKAATTWFSGKLSNLVWEG